MGHDLAGEQPDRRGHGRGGTRRGPTLRPAALMVAVGAVVVAAGLLVPDERWRLVAWIAGGMTAVAGLLTLGYSRLERNVPIRRPPWRS